MRQLIRRLGVGKTKAETLFVFDEDVIAEEGGEIFPAIYISRGPEDAGSRWLSLRANRIVRGLIKVSSRPQAAYLIPSPSQTATLGENKKKRDFPAPGICYALSRTCETGKERLFGYPARRTRGKIIGRGRGRSLGR